MVETRREKQKSAGSKRRSRSSTESSSDRHQRRSRHDSRPSRQNNASSTSLHNTTSPPPPPVPCQCCDKPIHPHADRVTVSPCTHLLCTLCALQSQVHRGSSPHKCPVDGCDCYSTSCTYISSSDAVEPTHIPNIIKGADNFVRNNLPKQWLKQQHLEELKADPNHQGWVLYCCKASVNEEKRMAIKSITSTFVLKKVEGKGEYYEVLNKNRALVEVQNFFSLLHHAILAPSNTAVKHLPVLSPRELLDHRCRERRLIDAALFSLGTGNCEFDDELYTEKDCQDHQKHFLSALVAGEVLLRNKRSSPGHFQLMFNELLFRQRVTKEFVDLCSALNLSTSRNFSVKDRAKEVLKQMKEGVNLNPRDLVILLFDNIGWRVLGRQAGYDQWILVNIVVVKEGELKKAGFYQDEDTSKQISREPSAVWKDEIKDLSPKGKKELFDKVIGPTKVDYERLSECVLEGILFAINYADVLSPSNRGAPAKLPRFDRIVNEATCNQMEELFKSSQNETDTGTSISSTQPSCPPVALPRNHMPTDVENELGGNGISRSVRGAGQFDSTDEEEGDTDEEEDSTATNNAAKENPTNGDDLGSSETLAKNRYEVNNTKLQAVHEDLSEKTSVSALIEYAVTSRNNQLQQWEEVKHKYPPTAEAPLAEIMTALGTDGQPAAQARRLLAEDCLADANLYPQSVFVSHGGLHTVMKALNATGEAFEEMLKDLIAAWRDSLDKIKYILFPNDPRQRIEEYPWLQLALCFVAQRNLGELEERSVSAVEVYDFMLKRAEEYPLCALLLLEQHMGNVIKLMRASERMGDKRGSVEYFFTALKFALPLFAVTHKSDYVYLSQEILKWYHCASPAQRKIYEEFIFTQLTTKGIPIFHDLFVELSVMDVRGHLGKVHRPGMDLAMEQVTAKLPASSGENTAARTLHDKTVQSTSSKSRTCSILSSNMCCPFYKVVEKIDSMQLMLPGEPPILKGKRNKPFECTHDLLQVAGGGQLHSDILSCITVEGRNRNMDYFYHYSINKPDEMKRSDNVVDLTKMKTTVDGLAEQLERRITLATSVERTDLLPRSYFTKELLKEQIKNMRESQLKIKKEEEAMDPKPAKPGYIKIPAAPTGSSIKKEVIVDHLIKHRKKLFKKHPDMAKNIKDEITNEFKNKGISSKESRVKLLKDEFFKLSESVRNKDRYNERKTE